MADTVELNEDTIIHIVRNLNRRGLSAQEAVEEGKVVGLNVTQGDKTTKVVFGQSVTFGDEERSISFTEKDSAPDAVTTEEAAPE